MDQPTQFDELPVGESAAHGRKAPRDSMFLAAELICGEGKVMPLRIRNISASGLMAEGIIDCAVGKAVTLRLRGVGEVDGRIVWIEEGRAGVAFDQPIDPRRTRKPVGSRKTERSEPIVLRRSGLRTE